MPNDVDIAAELDSRHTEARRAYANRDIAAYRRLFSPDLKYEQPNGHVIGLTQLMSDVHDQFSRVKNIGGEYQRETIEIHGPEDATEILTLTAWADYRVGFFFTKRWNVRRRGRYSWKKATDGWQITHVVVLEETVS